ncbi:NAD-dependent DNA ligase LigA [candidate division WOR-3 bacterium]|nr:NAD-dependent DNA ligase LigA [candidate division WOR-3 bacterium]
MRQSKDTESSQILKDILSEIDELKEKIRQRDYEYYVLDKPVITDEEYDKLFEKLKKIENEHPELVTADSPTQRIGEKLTGGFRTARHKIQMLSLDNTYSYEEIKDFDRKLRDSLKIERIEYVVEPKIDGVAVSVTYREGIFSSGLTRGDGLEGDDISENLKTVRPLPLRLKKCAESMGEILVRGEVYMKLQVLEKINRERAAKNQELFANTRNAAAGSLKNLDPSVVASRNLDIMFHTIIGKAWKKHSLAVAKLHECGLPVFYPPVKITTTEDLLEECGKWEKKRHELDYAVDGLVIKVDDMEFREILGQTMRSPKWAIAYKFPTQRAMTRIIDISIQVGRTGFLTPVAVMEPVKLKGSTISRASLYNADEIQRLDVRKGDDVLIEKGGEIIPKVVSVLKHAGRSEKFKMPDKCPVCGSPVVHYEGETAYRCISPACPAQLKAKILHFTSRGAMDITGFGDKLAQKLVDNDMVCDPGDLYSLSAADLSNLERMGEKSAQNIIFSIEKSKNNPLNKIFYAFGIPNIGVKTAKTLSEIYSSVDDLSSASAEVLTGIEDIGPVVAESIVDYFSLKGTKEMIEKMKKAGVRLSGLRSTHAGTAFKGKIFVITGTLSLPRGKFIEIIEKNGGSVSDSVSQKTDYLLAGESFGSKFEKAKKLGVKIIDENEFYGIFKTPSV